MKATPEQIATAKRAFEDLGVKAKPNGKSNGHAHKPRTDGGWEDAASYPWPPTGEMLFRIVRYVMGKPGGPKREYQLWRSAPDDPEILIWGHAAGEFMRKAPDQHWYPFKLDKWTGLPPTCERKHFEATQLPDMEAWLAAGYPREALEAIAGKAKQQAAGDPEDKIAELNKGYALVLVGGKAVVMKNESDSKFSLMPTGAFKTWLDNEPPVMVAKAVVPLSKFWLTSPQRRQYHGIVFAPNRSMPAHYNLWRGFACEPKKGDCSKFLEHIKTNVACGNDDLFKWVIGWIAHIFQHPDQKIGTSLALRGDQGTGKTKVGETIGRLLGNHYQLVSDPRYVVGRFNSHLISTLLLHADEAFWAGDHAAEGRLKDLVTGTKHHVELKGFEPIVIDNYVRLLVTGNSNWLVPAGLGERRFAVLDMGEKHKQDHRYFAAIDAQMKAGGDQALLYHLLEFDLSSVNLRTIPKTAALLDQKVSSLSTEQAWWLDMLKSGTLPWGCNQQGACPKDALFSQYIEHAKDSGARRRSIETQLGMFLGKVVPDLRIQRLTYCVKIDGITVDKQGRVYTFPPLAKCRKAFESILQQDLAWPEPDDDWTTT
jgi:hypothetical protein